MQILAFFLAIVIILLPFAVFQGLKTLTRTTSRSSKQQELGELENSVSHFLAELEQSVNDALTKTEAATDKLNQSIVAADQVMRELDEKLIRPAGPRSWPPVKSAKRPPVEAALTNPALPHPADRPRQEMIFDLAGQGWSAARIAREAGIGAGEVELILCLNRINKGREKDEALRAN